MIHGIGIDIIEIDRIRALREKQGAAFLNKCYTESELTYCKRKKNLDESLAARFAAKEAVMKALGTGWGNGVSFSNIEVIRKGESAPIIKLHRSAQELADSLGITTIHITLSHCKTLAIAQAIAEK